MTARAGLLPPSCVPEYIVFLALKGATFLFTFGRGIYGPEGTTDLAAVAVMLFGFSARPEIHPLHNHIRTQ
jgi:hypothetical protein